MLNIPLFYYLLALVIGIAVWILSKKISISLLSAYSFIIITKTILLRRPFDGNHFQPELFWSWKEWHRQSYQIITNIVMFIPIGVLAGWRWKWKGIIVAIGFSILIEILQLLTRRGLCEFDDMIHNVLGAAIGVVAVMIVRKVWNL